MTKFLNVHGTMPTVPEWDTTSSPTTIYHRTNIRPFNDDEVSGWIYDEEQMYPQEYLGVLGVMVSQTQAIANQLLLDQLTAEEAIV